MARTCSHRSSVKITQTDKHVCEDCVPIGGRWVHLRMCMTCGHVACCDSSPHQHATKHFASSSHPIVRSIEPGEAWVWCYEDEMIVDELPA